MVTEPVNIVAHSVFSNKGVYALLLGSGVSRAAEIPTGWEITLDLIRQVAALEKKDAGDKPEEWFIKHKKKQPDYSDLLNALSPTPDGRRAILSNYIEPTAEEREEGKKVPTKAHHAIAELVERGFIRVIITTNFDRLLEVALSQRGIEPIVISSDDDLTGAPPLAHGRCFVIKAHGDYLDTRIRNTPEELSAYSKKMNTYLDDVLDQFGLIVCGWSGAWDEALRSTIRRCPSRRYTTFWALRGEPHAQAQELIQKRDARVIPIASADQFFDELKEKTRALEDLRKPAPTDVRMATAMVKRYMSEERHRIRLRDTLIGQAEATMAALQAPPFTTNDAVSLPDFQKRLNFYEGTTEIIRAMLVTGAYWSSEAQHDLWPDLVQRLYNSKSAAGLVVWIEMRQYPAMLAFYAAGVSAVAAKNFHVLNRLLSFTFFDDNHRKSAAVEKLLPFTTGNIDGLWKLIEKYKRNHFPISEYLAEKIKHDMREVEPDMERVDMYFDLFELITSLSFGYEQMKRGEMRWFPLGRFGWKLGARSHQGSHLAQFFEEAEKQQAQWPPIRAGMFDGSYENFKKVKEAFDAHMKAVSPQFRW